MEFFGCESREDEAVDGRLRPQRVDHCGERRAPGGDEGPVFGVVGALRDPVAEGLGFGGGERPAGVGRRHTFVLVLRHNAEEEFTLGGFAGHDWAEVVARGKGVGAHVEAEFAFALRLVAAVALEAMGRKDRQHVAAEVNRFGRHRREGGQQYASGEPFHVGEQRGPHDARGRTPEAARTAEGANHRAVWSVPVAFTLLRAETIDGRAL